jgi:hypothetical protein
VALKLVVLEVVSTQAATTKSKVEDHSGRAAAKSLKGFVDFRPNEIDTGADIFVRCPDIFVGCLIPVIPDRGRE